MTLPTRAGIDHRLAGLDLREMQARAGDLGCLWDGSGLQVGFYGQRYRVSPDGVQGVDGQPPGRTVSDILVDYVSADPLEVGGGGPGAARGQITFRELPGAGPLVVAFANNTHKIIAQTFGADPARLAAACEGLKGHRDSENRGFDLVVEFSALPRVPLYLQFNAAEAPFPAEAGLLFRTDAPDYLGLPSLFALATYLTGSLISFESADG